MSEDIQQCMRPHGDDGVRTIEQMNEEHIPQIMWGIDNLPMIFPKKILDVGCGGGIFTKLILERYPDASVCAIDISELCIDYAISFNSSLVDEGRLELKVADVHSIPYEDGTFDLIVSNASHFFWCDIRKALNELGRVTRKGGTICLTAGLHFEEEPTEEQKKQYEGTTNMITDRRLQDLMTFAGFRTAIVGNRENSFCSYIGIKMQ